MTRPTSGAPTGTTGDGISVRWKSKDVLVDGGRVENNAVFGLHPADRNPLAAVVPEYVLLEAAFPDRDCLNEVSGC